MMRRRLSLLSDALLPCPRRDQKVYYRLVSTSTRNDQRGSPFSLFIAGVLRPYPYVDVRPAVHQEFGYVQLPLFASLAKLALQSAFSSPGTIIEDRDSSAHLDILTIREPSTPAPRFRWSGSPA